LSKRSTGIGAIERDVNISANRARPGDKILLSGCIGDHGMAIVSKRENLEFEGAIESDCAALHKLVNCMLEACDRVAAKRNGDHSLHGIRDPTRGGVETTLNEIASQSRVGMFLHEDQIPVHEGVQGPCEILGLDPLYVANEGKLVAIVAAEAADAVLRSMQDHPLGRDAKMIGEVVSEHPGMVRMMTRMGGHAHSGCDVRGAAAQDLLASADLVTAAPGLK